MSSKKILFVVGPTASGKTRFSLQVAQRFNAQIINADSIQVYQSLNVGSAKPSDSELKQIKHHLIGHIPSGENYTSAQFRKEVFNILDHSSHQNFLIVGGSGFYLKSLIYGLYDIPKISKEIHNQVRLENALSLYEELKKVDPLYASKIHPNDSYRISRAIEVFREHKKPFSEYLNQFEIKNFPYSYLKLGLQIDRILLRDRVKKRVPQMLEEGLIQEVEQLVQSGFENWKALQSVGYKEVLSYLKKKDQQSLESLIESITQNTMLLAKKQMTWFRKDSEIHWYEFDRIWEESKNQLDTYFQN